MSAYADYYLPLLYYHRKQKVAVTIKEQILRMPQGTKGGGTARRGIKAHHTNASLPRSRTVRLHSLHIFRVHTKVSMLSVQGLLRPTLV